MVRARCSNATASPSHASPFHRNRRFTDWRRPTASRIGRSRRSTGATFWQRRSCKIASGIETVRRSANSARSANRSKPIVRSPARRRSNSAKSPQRPSDSTVSSTSYSRPARPTLPIEAQPYCAKVPPAFARRSICRFKRSANRPTISRGSSAYERPASLRSACISKPSSRRYARARCRVRQKFRSHIISMRSRRPCASSAAGK